MKTFLKYLLRVLVLALVLTVLVPALTTGAEAAGTSVPDALPASSLNTTLIFDPSSLSVSLKLNSFPEGTRLLVMTGYKGGRLVSCDFIPPTKQTLDLNNYSPLNVDTLKLLCLGDNYRPLTFPKQIYPLNHSHNVVTVPGAEPDCVNPGFGETQYCADCGEVFSLGTEIAPSATTSAPWKAMHQAAPNGVSATKNTAPAAAKHSPRPLPSSPSDIRRNM